MNLLDVSRKVTFRVTLNVFFGLHSRDFSAAGIDEDGFIGAIVGYFKAWEYFLVHPKECWDSDAVSIHVIAVKALRQHVKSLLTAAIKPGDGETGDHRNELFIDNLRRVCQHAKDPTLLLEQSALEMMLAGTDTSSVTAYYALLGLASDAELQRELRAELQESSGKRDLLDSLINETLRFKPVGPVVLREAIEADLNFPSVPVEEGAAVLIHLAEMGQREEYWVDPKTFNPRRFVHLAPDCYKKFFFPFGEGPKGCIGMHLGRREVRAIVESIVMQYDMAIEGAETLSSLETHWDIANQPDKPARILVSNVIQT